MLEDRRIRCTDASVCTPGGSALVRNVHQSEPRIQFSSAPRSASRPSRQHGVRGVPLARSCLWFPHATHSAYNGTRPHAQPSRRMHRKRACGAAPAHQFIAGAIEHRTAAAKQQQPSPAAIRSGTADYRTGAVRSTGAVGGSPAVFQQRHTEHLGRRRRAGPSDVLDRMSDALMQRHAQGERLCGPAALIRMRGLHREGRAERV